MFKKSEDVNLMEWIHYLLLPKIFKTKNFQKLQILIFELSWKIWNGKNQTNLLISNISKSIFFRWVRKIRFLRVQTINCKFCLNNLIGLNQEKRLIK